MTQFHIQGRVLAGVALLFLSGCVDGSVDFDFPVSKAAQQADWPGLKPLSAFDSIGDNVPVARDLEATAARVAALRRRAASLSAPILSPRERARLTNG